MAAARLVAAITHLLRHNTPATSLAAGVFCCADAQFSVMDSAAMANWMDSPTFACLATSSVQYQRKSPTVPVRADTSAQYAAAVAMFAVNGPKVMTAALCVSDGLAADSADHV